MLGGEIQWLEHLLEPVFLIFCNHRCLQLEDITPELLGGTS